MRSMILLLAALLSLNSTGCGWLVVGRALDRHYDARDREIEYRHQERMKELQLQEKALQQQKPAPATTGAIVRENPF